MAKFVLAGKADCPQYARAELLADLLQRILPDFRIHKICVHPNEWKSWLEDACSANGWKHESCPIVWRELTDRGGKGSLLGGLGDFLEHAQGYYGITYNVEAEQILKVAAENLEAMERRIQEEQRKQELLQPSQIWISGALNPVCYNLIPLLFMSDAFSDLSSISIHLLDLDSCDDSLSGLKMEIEDQALPQLLEVTIHTDLSLAFHSADLIIFLDDCPPEEREPAVGRMAERFSTYGQVIEAHAKKDVRVLVAGGAFTNLKCSLLIKAAPSVDPCRFAAVATQLENEARAQVAAKLSVRTSDIAGVIIWGNISGSFHIDLQRATVSGHEGAVWGPNGFCLKVLDLVHDGKWLKEVFPCLVESRRRAVSIRTERSTAISTAAGIITTLNAWLGRSSPEVFSVGVASMGHFGVPAGIVFCLPVTFQGGEWSICSDVTVDAELRSKLEAAANEISQETAMASGRTMKDPAS